MTNSKVQPLVSILETLVYGICSKHEFLEFKSKEIRQERTEVIIHPHTADVPKLIGKDGRIIKGLEKMMDDGAANSGKLFQIELTDVPQKGKREPDKHIPTNPSFQDEPLRNLIADYLNELGDPNASVNITVGGGERAIEIIPSWSPGVITWDLLVAINHVFRAYGKAQGAGDIIIKCEGVEAKSACV